MSRLSLIVIKCEQVFLQFSNLPQTSMCLSPHARPIFKYIQPAVFHALAHADLLCIFLFVLPNNWKFTEHGKYAIQYETDFEHSTNRNCPPLEVSTDSFVPVLKRRWEQCRMSYFLHARLKTPCHHIVC